MQRTTLEMRLRLLVIGLVLMALFVVLVSRLFWIQGVKAEEYTKQAEKIWQREKVLKPRRGDIWDRNGSVLAQDAQAYTIAVYLPAFRAGQMTADEAAAQLAPLLKMDASDIEQRLLRTDVNQVELKTSGFSYKVSKEVKDEIMALNIAGVHALPTSKRYYLNDELAAHVLGFLNNEGEPVKGIEAAYNDILRGVPGEVLFSKDASGMEVASREKRFRPPVDGKHIVLTIDRRIQEVVEGALNKVVEEYSPQGATAIVMDPNNGEILAMASRPTFNPNAFYDAKKDHLVNMATESAFEPGSTFKVITLAAALEERKFNPDGYFRSGSVRIENREIHDWSPGGWGDITFLEGVQRSSNVAFVLLQRALGKTFDQYVERFGFGPYGKERSGTPTGIDLNEGSGLMPSPERLKNSRLERATSAYGHGLSVTPIQLTSAVSAAVNGGTLYRPHLLKEVRHPKTGKVLETYEPVAVRKGVISEDASKQLREILHSVIVSKKGTGKEADVPGYSIGGKTGTATKYTSSGVFASFVGFAPVDDPQVVLYVAVDEPKGGQGTGGSVAAPTARQIFKQILPLLQVEPKQVSQKTKVEKGKVVVDIVDLPDLTGKPTAEVQKTLNALGLKAQVLGAGEEVVDYVPRTRQVNKSQTVFVLTENVTAVPMPDLRSLSLREAMEVCNMLGLNVKVKGKGFVYAQSLKPGHPINRSQSIQLTLKPTKPATDG